MKLESPVHSKVVCGRITHPSSPDPSSIDIIIIRKTEPSAILPVPARMSRSVKMPSYEPGWVSEYWSRVDTSRLGRTGSTELFTQGMLFVTFFIPFKFVRLRHRRTEKPLPLVFAQDSDSLYAKLRLHAARARNPFSHFNVTIYV
jgi:hypothetical protein